LPERNEYIASRDCGNLCRLCDRRWLLIPARDFAEKLKYRVMEK
jgi:hypothetical protein